MRSDRSKTKDQLITEVQALREQLDEIERLQPEQTTVEEALLASEEKYRTLTENLNVGIYRSTIGDKGHFIEVNPTFLNIFGYANKKEVLSLNVSDLYVNPYDRKVFNSMMLKRGYVKDEELKLRKKDGTHFIGSVSVVAVKDENNKFIYFDGVIEDITKRKQAENNIIESHRELQLLERINKLALQGKPVNTVINEVSKAFVRISQIEALTVYFYDQKEHRLIPQNAGINKTSALIVKSLARVNIKDFAPRLVEGSRFTEALEKDRGFLTSDIDEIVGLFGEYTESETLRKLIKPVMKRIGVKSFGTIALKSGDIPLGLITFTTKEILSEEEFESVKRFGTQLTEILTRIRAEELRQQSEEKFRELADLLPQTVFEMDLNANITYSNQFAFKAMGYTPEDLVKGLNVSQLIAEEDHAKIQNNISRIIAGEIPEVSDYMIVRKDGSKFPALIYSRSIIRDNDVKGLRGIIVDITERKRVEEELRKSEAKLRNIVEHSTNLFYSHTSEHELTYLSPQSREFIQCDPEEAMVRWTEFATDNPINEEGFALTEKAIKTGKRQPPYELELVGKKGRVIWVEVHEAPVVEKGKTVAIVGSLTDITERKRADEELKSNQEYTSNLIDSSLDMIISVDEERRIVEFNQAAQENFGYSREELLGQHIDVLYADVSEGLKVNKETKRTGRFSGEIMNRRKNGGLFPAFLSSSKLQNAKGEHIGTMGISRDITERKQVEDALRQSEERFRNAFDHAVIGRAVAASPGNFILVNKSFCKMLGYTEEALLQKTWQKITHPDDFEESTKYAQQLMAGLIPSFRYVHRVLHSSGATVWIDLTVVLIRNLEGEPLYVIGDIVDVTEQRQLEEQLRQAQKMEAIGQLAGGVAHDFNNLLAAIIGYSEMSLLKIDDDSPISENLNNIITRSEQGAKLVSQLLAFSRKQNLTVIPMNLNDVVDETVQFLRHAIGEDIELTMELDPILATIEADPTALNQIITNLCVNARDAMQEGGKLGIRTQNVVLDDEYCETHTWASPGKYVKLTVTDTGIGMDEETQKQIFDPFFTTKERWQGTGLGLSMVFGLVKQHKGHIDCTSELGKGATFELYFPVIIALADRKAGAEAQEVQPGHETILLVEDDPDVNKSSKMVLEHAGYTVLTAQDGKEGLKKYTDSRKTIDLVIIDIILPKLGGVELYQAIHEINPEMKFLFISGYAGTGIYEKYHLEASMELLLKPFRINDITSKVREILDK